MKKYIIGLLTLLGFVTAGVVYGNTSYFAPIAQTNTATSTPQFLTVGATAATTTPVVYDSYGIDGTNENAGQKSDATDSVSVLEYVQASSTLSVFVTRIEFSDGVPGVSCKTTPLACDWYENSLETYAAGSIAIATPNSYTYTYASTTPDTTNALTTAAQNRGTRIINLKVPTRYMRVYTFVTGANGSVYLKLIPKKQQQQ